jgi:two-component sensor histidine kinase
MAAMQLQSIAATNHLALTLLAQPPKFRANGAGMNGFDYIKRSVRVRPLPVEGIVRTAIAIAVPTALRWLIDRGANGDPFLLYFPAIQMISTFLGWRWGALTAVGSAITCVYFFMVPTLSFATSSSGLVVLTMFTIAAGTMVVIGHLLRSLVLENAERAHQSDAFNRELQHRTKNSLQMMRALAAQASKATDPAEFYEKLAGRLGALAKANELLRFGALKSCDMTDLVQAAVAPFGHEQITTRGPSCRVAGDACTPLVMALHELGTNAHKYGALSSPNGKVELVWRIGEGHEIELLWTESGGPTVSPPTRRGLGMRLLVPQGQMTGVNVRYLPQGLTCAITVQPDSTKPRGGN